MQERNFWANLARLIIPVIFVVGIGTVLGSNFFLWQYSKEKVSSEKAAVWILPEIAVAADGKSVISAETGETIFTIEAAQEYLNKAELAYNSSTFETTNEKYAGNCFEEAVLSNDKQKIIFSTSCLPGDMVEAWIGVYELLITDSYCLSDVDHNEIIPSASACIGDEPQWGFRFLQSGRGEKFIWSQDDGTVNYEGEFRNEPGLKKIIDVNTGNVTITENCEEYNDKLFNSKYECYGYVARENKDESLCGKLELPEMRADCYLELAMVKNDYSICENNHMTAALGSDCAEYFGKINKGGTFGTEDWKTFNGFTGFEVKYPANFALELEGIIAMFYPPKGDDRLYDGIISITVAANPKERDLQSWLSESPNYYSQAEADQIKKDFESGKIEIGIGYKQKEITLDGSKALDQYIDGQGGSERYVFIPYGSSNIIIISLESDYHMDSATDESVKNIVEIFDKMLLTFKFKN